MPSSRASTEFHLSLAQLRGFFTQLHLLVESGIGLLDALEAMAREAPEIDQTVERIHLRLRAGSELEAAFGKASSSFDRLTLGLLRLGRETGMLVRVLGRLAERSEERYRRAQHLRAALSYPIGILSLAGLCCLVITWILLPQLASVLESFGAEPPLPTRILLAIAHYRFWLFNLLAAPLVGLAFFYRFHRQRWDRWWRESLYRLPLVGNLWVARGQADLAEDLALASEAGLALVEALRLLAQSSQDPLLGPALARLAKALEDGYEIDQALAGEAALSPNLRHSLVVGLNTGKLVVLLKATARNLAQELRFRTDQLLALLEPVVMAGLGCLTGFVVIASLLPIYTVVNSV